MAAREDRVEPLANPTRPYWENAMSRAKLSALVAAALLILAAAGPVAGTHGGPHEQRLPDAACNEGTLAARAEAPGAPAEDPRRRIPHRHTLIIDGQTESGCYHYNDQFPPAQVIS